MEVLVAANALITVACKEDLPSPTGGSCRSELSAPPSSRSSAQRKRGLGICWQTLTIGRVVGVYTHRSSA